MGKLYGIKINQITNTAYIKEFDESMWREAFLESMCVCYAQDDAWEIGNMLNEKLSGNKTYLKYIGMKE